jgi:GT2 family glycosyltransferase
MTPPVSVVIVNYNGAHLLPECLASLESQVVGPLDVVVVDNGSIDDSAAVTQHHGCRFLPLGENLGLAAGYNRGAAATSGEFVFFVNNDMRFEPDCVARLTDVLVRNPGVFAADPLQWNWTGDRVIHGRSVFERISSLKELFSRAILPLPPRNMNYTALASAVAPVPWGCGGSLMVRRSMLEQVGGWDEKYFISGFDDADLCWRAWLLGMPTVFVPNARLFHKAGASNDDQLHAATDQSVRRRLKPLTFERIMGHHRNHLRFAFKMLDASSVIALLCLKSVAPLVYVVRRPMVARALLFAVAEFVAAIPEILPLRRRIARSATHSSSALIARFSQ